MAFRWWPEPPATLVVQHVLDAGRLRIALPRSTPDPGATAIARAVGHALDHGWRTHEHLDHAVSDVEWAAMRGVAWRPPTVDAAGPLPRPVLAPDGPALALQLRPYGVPPVVLHTWTGATSGVRLQRGALDVETPVDPELVEDLLVAVRADRPARLADGTPGCPVHAVLIDGRGRWEAESDALLGRGRIRRALVGAWRLAFGAWPDDPAVQPILQELHPLVLPEEPPVLVDADRRRIVVFGRPRADHLAELLGTHPGPWIVDARRLLELQGTSRRLRGLLKRRRTSFVWIGETHALQEAVYLGLRVAPHVDAAKRLLVDGAHELFEQALLTTMSPDHVVEAGEALTGSSATRRAAWSRVPHWFGPTWTVAPADHRTAGWWFTDRFAGWHAGLPDTGFVLAPHRFWFRTPDGRVWTTPATGRSAPLGHGHVGDGP
jgi:hypothetical protein